MHSARCVAPLVLCHGAYGVIAPLPRARPAAPLNVFALPPTATRSAPRRGASWRGSSTRADCRSQASRPSIAARTLLGGILARWRHDGRKRRRHYARACAREAGLPWHHRVELRELVPRTDRPARDIAEIQVTPEMIEAGVGVILREIGGSDLRGHFSSQDLAARVYRAMDNRKR